MPGSLNNALQSTSYTDNTECHFGSVESIIHEKQVHNYSINEANTCILVRKVKYISRRSGY